MRNIKKAITVRIDPTLLEKVREGAALDNRSVTNFIETALRQRLSGNIPRRSRKINKPQTLNGN